MCGIKFCIEHISLANVFYMWRTAVWSQQKFENFKKRKNKWAEYPYYKEVVMVVSAVFGMTVVVLIGTKIPKTTKTE